jgi:hypothetical protein
MFIDDTYVRKSGAILYCHTGTQLSVWFLSVLIWLANYTYHDFNFIRIINRMIYGIAVAATHNNSISGPALEGRGFSFFLYTSNTLPNPTRSLFRDPWVACCIGVWVFTIGTPSLFPQAEFSRKNFGTVDWLRFAWNFFWTLLPRHPSASARLSSFFLRK